MFLVCSFICEVFLCFFIIIIFLTYYVWGLLFLGSMLNSFFLLVSSLLRLAQWFVWAMCRVRFMLRFFLLLLFVFPLMGKAEWGDNPVCWWLGLYFCFVCCLDEASCTGFYWCLGEARTCIPVVSFVWVLTLWYSLGFVLWYSRSWSQCSHSKGQGLISGQEQRFHKWFFMALSEMQTNVQNWETKDQPQTNGCYKIRQIIIKIMQYTPMCKVKTVQKQ